MSPKAKIKNIDHLGIVAGLIDEIVNYAGIKQVWLVVESQKRKESDLEKLDKKLKKEKEKVEKFLKELKKENFDNPEQARYKLKAINKKLNFFELQITQSKSKENKTIYKGISMFPRYSHFDFKWY